MSVPLYSPVVLAEELATLDILSGGRLVVGVGAGYRQEEFAAMGVPYHERYARFEEGVALMKEIWTKDAVGFSGQFHTVRGRRHLAPIQDPHPPIWIGAQGPKGVQRAARLGAEWIITPQLDLARVTELLRVYAGALAPGANAPTPFPMRREMMLGRDREDALRRFATAANCKYVAYAQQGMKAFTEERLIREFDDVARGHAILGNAQDVISQLTELVQTLPVDPLILRPHWPGMDVAGVAAYFEEMRAEVFPALRELRPASAIPD